MSRRNISTIHNKLNECYNELRKAGYSYSESLTLIDKSLSQIIRIAPIARENKATYYPSYSVVPNNTVLR